MQTFDSFHNVYKFCLHAHMDPEYVARIDSELESGSASPETKKLIQEVQAFHNIRLTLCNTIKGNLNNAPLLSALHKASGLEQYNSVPDKSMCAICNERLSDTQGILIVVDGVTPYTVHSRYKVILYNFWILVHFPAEIVKSSKDERSNKTIHVPETVKTISERVECISCFQGMKRSKNLYLKLKGIAQYIQTEFPMIPINKTSHSEE